MADALPLLKQAEAVNVLTVRDGKPLPEGHLPDTEIAAALARHGVKVDLADIIATEYTIGEEIRVNERIWVADDVKICERVSAAVSVAKFASRMTD